MRSLDATQGTYTAPRMTGGPGRRCQDRVTPTSPANAIIACGGKDQAIEQLGLATGEHWGDMQRIEVRTHSRQQFVEITAHVQAVLRESAVTEGICILWSTHTTAGLTVNENADPNVVRDMTAWLAQQIPQDPAYHHAEGNSDSHIKTTLVGPGLTLIVSKGELQLGRWQGVYLCEFDGPRTRTVLATFIPE